MLNLRPSYSQNEIGGVKLISIDEVELNSFYIHGILNGIQDNLFKFKTFITGILLLMMKILLQQLKN